MTPDDIIVLDYLIYRSGNAAEIESWERMKKTLIKLAHGNQA